MRCAGSQRPRATSWTDLVHASFAWLWTRRTTHEAPGESDLARGLLRDMAPGEIAERHRGPDRRAATGVRGTEHARRDVPGGVQAGDDATTEAAHACVPVDERSAVRAERPVAQPDRVEGRLPERRHADARRRVAPAHVHLELRR